MELGELDGIRYVHRQPCREEQRHIIKQHMIRVNTIRAVVTLYEITVYLWAKIPLKEEAKLIFRILQRTYVGLRGFVYYWWHYGKKV